MTPADALAAATSLPAAGQLFDIGGEWKKYEFPFSVLGKTDGTNIVMLLVGAAQAEGPFKMEIDQVRLETVPAGKTAGAAGRPTCAWPGAPRTPGCPGAGASADPFAARGR